MKTLCPNCQQHVEADDQMAGLVVICPTCQKEFTLPKLQSQTPVLKRIEIPILKAFPQNSFPGSGLANNRTFQIVVVCTTFLIGLLIWRGTTGHVATFKNSDGTTIKVDVSAIESVLNQDSGSSRNGNGVAGAVQQMKAIDTSGCPGDFRAAYLAHIHAWEAMYEIQQQAIRLKNESNSDGAVVESFIRGFMGDPFGKVNEQINAQNQLAMAAQNAHQQIKLTFNKVQEIAVTYGAKLPTRK